jgi:hypothetical protein
MVGFMVCREEPCSIKICRSRLPEDPRLPIPQKHLEQQIQMMQDQDSGDLRSLDFSLMKLNGAI